MDISQWLENIESPETPPSLPEQLGLPAFLHRKQETKEPIPNRRRRQKRTLTDSSILEVQPGLGVETPSGHAVDIADEAWDSPSSGASDSSEHLSDNSASSHPYARKPRRKTRLERYEPKSNDTKARGKYKRKRARDESKKARRRSKRKKADSPGARVVQSFRAKNVPKDRLTVGCR